MEWLHGHPRAAAMEKEVKSANLNVCWPRPARHLCTVCGKPSEETICDSCAMKIHLDSLARKTRRKWQRLGKMGLTRRGGQTAALTSFHEPGDRPTDRQRWRSCASIARMISARATTGRSTIFPSTDVAPPRASEDASTTFFAHVSSSALGVKHSFTTGTCLG
jgi:hypothetical protein